MAALLRSSRLLRFSPSGLLQISGTTRTGPPLSRLYSGALGGARSGVCTRQIRLASENAPSRVWPYAAPCVRSYVVATEQRDEVSVAVRSKQAQGFDWALSKLDSSVRRTGRITKTLLLRIFHDICRTGYPSGNQALLLLRSCGSLLPEVPLEERTELAHRIWDRLQELGAQYDVSHYNALLKVYVQNEFKFSPTDFLAKMEAANVQPNRVTYQRLIAAYCQNGHIEGASTILGFMKSKDLPITEAVFNSLVTGHARAGDIESAKNILTVMSGAGIEPGPDTYVALLCAYAEKGDMESLKKTVEAAESADCNLMDRDFMQIISTLAKSGQGQHIPEMVERLKLERGYIPDSINLCLNLITHGLEDTAFLMLKTIPTLQPDGFSNESPNQGNFFLRHCVNMDTSVEKIRHYCKELQESNLHTSALTFSLHCALEAKKTAMALELMTVFKEQGLPIRPHYFWPLLTQHVKDKNTAGVIEVLRGMQELGVSPDVETLSIYSLPAFPSSEAARQALKDAGVSLNSEGLLHSELRTVALNNLAELYTMLSDPSSPSLDITSLRNTLILSFRKSDDVESMVKITELMLKSKGPDNGDVTSIEKGSFFFYNLINNMSDKEVQAQEGKLRKFFNQLHAQNITISLGVFRGIRNLLESYQVPELIKDVSPLVDPRSQESFESPSSAPLTAGSKGKLEALERKLNELKAEGGSSLGLVLRQLIQAHCAEENLQRALELKQQHEEEMTEGAYSSLIHLCCRLDNAEEALNLKREMSRKDSSVLLNPSRYIALVRTLANTGKLEEAVDILKEIKEKGVALDDTHVNMLVRALHAMVPSGNAAAIKRLQDTIFTLGLAKPTTYLCSPLIGVYLSRKDLSGALEATMECYKLYKNMPRIHSIVVGLVEKGDTEQLQKAMDFVSQTRGEMTMLYDLFFAFLQTGRYREARKIVETPGMRARHTRLQWFADRCIASNQMEALEQMVDITAKLFECDRDEMYSYMLRLCKDTNDWKKAETVWTKMQDENIIPRERTLHMLADILKSNGQEVPFEVPEMWYEQTDTEQTDTEQTDTKQPDTKQPDTKQPETKQPDTKQPETKTTREEAGPEYQTRLMMLCKRGKIKEAYGMLKSADKKGAVLTQSTYDQVIRALLAEGSMEEAMTVRDIAVTKVPDFKLSDIASSMLIITLSKRGQTEDALENLKSMLSADRVPSQLAFTRLTQALGNRGDVAGIQVVESLVKDLGTSLNLSSMIFVNNMALAHIKNGDLDSAVEVMEATVMNPDRKTPGMAYVFRKVLEENNDKALDKLSAMAERLANHFASYRLASDLFVVLLDMDKVEDAKFMLARLNGLAEQREVLLSYVAQKAQSPGQVGKIKTLANLIPDFIEKELLCTYLMKCHSMDKDLSSAKALYEEMQKEGRDVDKLSLKRLAVLYRNAGEIAPFPEPPESFKFYADDLKKRAEAQKATEE